MNLSAEIELEKFIAKIPQEDLPGAAASILESWCEKVGDTPASCTAFLEAFVDAQENEEKRNALIAALDAYRTPDWAKQ